MTAPDAPPRLRVLPDRVSVCRLSAEAEVPDWALRAAFASVTRTRGELSVVCDAAQVPAEVVASAGWRVVELVGPFPFDAVGVLLRVLGPLAAAGVSVLPIATYDTDYVLVRDAQLAAAVDALRAAGLGVTDAPAAGAEPAR